MAKINWKTVCDRLLARVGDPDYVYFYGAKDILLTKEVMEYLIAAEPKYFSRYSKAQLEQIKRNSIGRRGVDCSAVTGWLGTGDKQYSAGQIGNCYQYNKISEGPAGSLLYTSWGGAGRHIGMDVGSGLCVQAGWESTDENIRLKRAGIFLSPIKDTAWEMSGMSTFVDYSGAPSHYEPASELWAKIQGEPSKIPKYVEQATTLVNVRTGAGATYPNLKEYPRLGEGNKVDYCDEKKVPGGALWHYVRIAGKHYGWVNSRYLKKI